MKKFCESLKEHTMKIINFKKKKNDVIIKVTAEIVCLKFFIFINKTLTINMLNKKIIVNLGINVIIQENIEVLKIAYVT